MLICIVGTQCSGKASVREYLEGLGFQNIRHDTPPEPHENVTCHADFTTLLNKVTQDWRNDFVCTSITNLGMLRSCAQRPFFVLISVDAPILTRWERYKKRRLQSSVSLEEFIQQSDMERFGPQIDSTHDPLNEILKALPHVSITNSFSSLPELHAHLDSLALRSTERVRPGWDDYFM
ncbi:Deoxycytidine monophosphate (dCMP) deaminase, partial [Ceratobasidium sp. 428]